MTEDYSTLINLLIVKTKSGKAKWETTSARRTYQTYIDGNFITIYTRDNTLLEFGIDKEPEAVLAINGMDGEEIDSVKVYVTTSKDYSLLDELYNVAKRNALNLDQTITNLISSLKKM